MAPAEVVRGADLIITALGAEGPQTRDQLRRRLSGAGLPTDGQALVHLLAVASSTGAVVRGPVVGAEQAFVAVADWIGPAPRALGREQALARLATRYLAGHAPAGPRTWPSGPGISLGDARQGARPSPARSSPPARAW